MSAVRGARHDGVPTPWARLANGACLLAIVAGMVVFATHAAAYFFLFDDFALNGQASRWPLGDILRTPLFGFYRPAVFLLVRAEHAIFGWQHPSGYMAVALGIHAVNAWLVGRLTRRLTSAPVAALVAGTLFWLSPWAGEAVFWMSGLFDVCSTTGVLVALVAGLAAVDRETKAWRPMAGAAAAALVACFSKESAVVAGALFLVVWLGCQPAGRGWRRPLAVAGVLGAIGIASLVGRTLVLRSVDAGAYGGWWSLVSAANLSTNLRLFATAVVSLPAPHDSLMRPVGVMRLLAPLLPLTLGLVVAAAALRRRRVTLAAAAAMAIALLPVVWVLLRIPGSAGGRVLYLPGAFLCLAIGTGVQSLLELRPAASRALALAAAGVLLVQSAASVQAQSQVWAASGRLSRQAIEAFRPYVGRPDPIHVSNLPFWFEEGPYVLKSYAFGYYYHPAATPPVSATALSLTFAGGDARVTMRQAEPGVAPVPSGGTAVELAIGLH